MANARSAAPNACGEWPTAGVGRRGGFASRLDQQRESNGLHQPPCSSHGNATRELRPDGRYPWQGGAHASRPDRAVERTWNIRLEARQKCCPPEAHRSFPRMAEEPVTQVRRKEDVVVTVGKNRYGPFVWVGHRESRSGKEAIATVMPVQRVNPCIASTLAKYLDSPST